MTIHIDDVTKTLELTPEILQQGEDFFAMMDRDMDKGWQMSREWVEKPNVPQRCQIAADRMLNAVSTENETLLMLMAGYILSRAPQVTEVRIDTSGEMMETELITQ